MVICTFFFTQSSEPSTLPCLHPTSLLLLVKSFIILQSFPLGLSNQWRLFLPLGTFQVKHGLGELAQFVFHFCLFFHLFARYLLHKALLHQFCHLLQFQIIQNLKIDIIHSTHVKAIKPLVFIKDETICIKNSPCLLQPLFLSCPSSFQLLQAKPLLPQSPSKS